MVKTFARLTEQPLIVLWFCFEKPVNPLDGGQLHLHVCKVPHHPVHIVGHLIGREAELVNTTAARVLSYINDGLWRKA